MIQFLLKRTHTMKVQKSVPLAPKIPMMINLMTNLLSDLSHHQDEWLLCWGHRNRVNFLMDSMGPLKYYAKVSVYEQFSERSQNFH